MHWVSCVRDAGHVASEMHRSELLSVQASDALRAAAAEQVAVFSAIARAGELRQRKRKRERERERERHAHPPCDAEPLPVLPHQRSDVSDALDLWSLSLLTSWAADAAPDAGDGYLTLSLFLLHVLIFSR